MIFLKLSNSGALSGLQGLTLGLMNGQQMQSQKLNMRSSWRWAWMGNEQDPTQLHTTWHVWWARSVGQPAASPFHYLLFTCSGAVTVVSTPFALSQLWVQLWWQQSPPKSTTTKQEPPPPICLTLNCSCIRACIWYCWPYMAGPECIGAPSRRRNWFFWKKFRGVHSWPVSPSSKGASEALFVYWQRAKMQKAQGGDHESFYCIHGILAGSTSTFSSPVPGGVWQPPLSR